jgi:hypothetical protein
MDHGLFDIPARAVCWQYNWWLLVPFMLGNLFTATAYFHIPWSLFRIVRGRPGKWLSADVGLAAAFIALCGGGHFIGGALLVFWGLYPFAVTWDFLTGVVSWVFAIRLRRKLAHIITAPDVQDIVKLRDFWEERRAELAAHPLTERPTDFQVRHQIDLTINLLDRAMVQAGVTT